MCTVTYLPKGKDQFILTSNRDESPLRSPQAIFISEDQQLLFPKEPSKGGTWICVSKNNRVLCLLNGAFDKHHHQPPYKRSRGLVVLDFFTYPSAQNFMNDYDFEGIEPFTLVIYDNGELFEFRWDGQERHPKVLDVNQPQIWSSSTLYTEPVKELRRNWFAAWLNTHSSFEAPEILHFHKTAGMGDSENDLIMSRHNAKVCTVSITQVEKGVDFIKLSYNDLIHDQVHHSEIELEHCF